MIRINNIKIREDLTNELLIKNICKIRRININNIKKWNIYKKSIDARNKNDVYYNYTIDIEFIDSKYEEVFNIIPKEEEYAVQTVRESKLSPVVVGMGPAGLFAALTMVNAGIKPVIIEQGSKVEERVKDVEDFIINRKLNVRSNIQFGEGGAGTFSDGKLNTGNKSKFIKTVLKELVKFGAPEEILYNAKPHVGTDNLILVVKNIRNYLISKGAKVHFNEKLVDIIVENGNIKKVICEKLGEIETDTVVLAIGHSAKDTFKLLKDLNVVMKPKNFAVGVRIEHLQKDINNSQYGNITKLKLPPAEYKLVKQLANGRTAYTFCMCPGGYVMASSSEENTVVTNGMSKYLRDGINSNSALLVNVNENDFKTDDPLAGIYFQEDLEKKAFVLGGSNYNAPVQRVEDFLNNKRTESLGKVNPTYTPGITLSNLNEILPEFVGESLKLALKDMDKSIKGFADKDAILTGVETRTSSPIQITRDIETMMSNIQGLYPCGEGAGYAGGIMTAAIDGIKVAIKVLESK